MLQDLEMAATPSMSSSAERCVEFMLGQIRSGRLRPMQRIGERNMGRRMGLGRGPVRTAIQHLTSLGLLHRLPRSGTFVQQMSIERFCEAMDVRAVLEGFAGRLACKRATPEELDRLAKTGEAIDLFQERVTHPTTAALIRVMKWENEFHLGIVRISGNRELERMLGAQHLIQTSFQLGIRLPRGIKNIRKRGIPHRDIIRSLRKGDEEESDRMLRQHVLIGKEVQLDEIKGVSTSL